MFYIAFHQRNRASLHEIETAWPVRRINQACEYLQAIDDGDYMQYSKNRRDQERAMRAKK